MDVSDISLFRRDLTPADIAGINDEISVNDKAIASINVDIESVRRQLEQLHMKRSIHMALINRCKGALTLARRIPPELLAKIFEHSAESWARSPFIVSQVCAAWRRAAQIPRVWSHISINCHLRDPIRRTRLWLQMARQAPLDITIVGTNLPQNNLTQIADLLLCHAPQWRSFTIDLLLGNANYVLSRCTGVFPLLRSINVISPATFEDLDGGTAHLDGLQQSFLHSPKLKSAEIVSNIVPPIVPSHVSNLSLKFTDSPARRPLSAISLLRLLEGLPGLKRLKIIMPVDFEHPFIPELDTSLTASLPRLESLTLEDTGGLSWILRHIRAPSLTCLHLRTPESENRIMHEGDNIGTTILDFLKVSSRVQLFELHNVDIWAREFTSWFASLPELHELRLHDSDIDDEALRGLYGRGRVCPHLSRIDLRWCHHVRGTTLIELVRSRLVTGEMKSSDISGDEISEVAALHCSLVRKQDVINLAKLTRVRVVFTENDDHCRARQCCDNIQYRNRLRFYCMTLSKEEQSEIRLILD